MFLFSALLFINGLPVDYSVSRENECYIFEPIFNPHFDLIAPEFIMQPENEVYIFKDLNDIDIIAQAEEALKEHLSRN